MTFLHSCPIGIGYFERIAFELPERNGAIGYIMDCYGALHTTGAQHIVDDLDRFIANRKRSLV